VHLEPGVSGRVHITDISDNAIDNPLADFVKNQTVTAYVLQVTEKKAAVMSVGDAAADDSSSDSEDYEPAAIASRKRKVVSKKSAAASKSNASTPAVKQIDLSLRASLCSPNSADVEDSAEYSRPSSVSELKLNQLVRGYVKVCTKKGCFITLSRHVDARVLLKDLSDKFVRDVAETFPAGTMVLGRVTRIHEQQGQVDLSLKRSVVNPPKDQLKFDQLVVNSIVKGKVSDIKDYGLFIKLRNSNLTGLCHISQVADVEVKSLAAHYEVGDRVKAVVLMLDESKNRISLGLKPSLLAAATGEKAPETEASDAMVVEETVASADAEAADDADEADEESDESEEEVSKQEDSDDTESGGDEDDAAGQQEDNDQEEEDAEESDASSDSDSDSDSESDDAVDQAAKLQAIQAAFAAQAQLDMPVEDSSEDEEDIPDLNIAAVTAPAVARGDSSDSDETEDASDNEQEETKDKKKGRRARATEKKGEERLLAQQEIALMDGEAPETAEDYERLVTSNPRSSYRWIKYIAYQVGLAMFDKARIIVARALKAIPPSDEQERFNIWITSLNLEHLYGTPDSLKEVLVRAAAASDAAKVYTEMAKIYAEADQEDQAKATYELILKKYPSSQAYTSYANYMIAHNGSEQEVKALLNRALDRLPTREHVALISKFAQAEYKVGGVTERGRTMFEGILKSYPKKLDVWSVYLDMETRALTRAPSDDIKAIQNIASHIRRIYERSIVLPLSSKKMKFFFKRYLEFEQTHGDAETQEHVREKAREYVLSRS
jgi:rRNA biogenesis protein RRP5